MKKNNTRKRKIIWLIVALAIAAIIGVVIYVSSGEKAVKVQSDKVTKGELSQVVSASGHVNPAIKVEISANISGEIQKIHVREGDAVAKGQILVELDNRRYLATNEQSSAALKASKAQLRLSEAQLEMAEKTFQRQEELLAKKLTTKEAFDNAKTQLDVARASRDATRDAIRQAEAGLNLSADELGKTTIRSPMEGVVTRLQKEEGEIAIGSTLTRDVIMVIADPGQMVAEVEVDEADIVNVRLSNAAKVEVDALPGEKFDSKVIEIAGAATVNELAAQTQQDTTVTFAVKVLLEGDISKIRPGMSATADIITETKQDVFQVPIQCLTMRDPATLDKKAEPAKGKPGEDAGAVLGDITKMKEVLFAIVDHRVKPVWVETGISSDTHYEISGEGLTENLEVVSGPFKTLNRELKPGDLVEVGKGEPEKK
ncbi:MAG: efflux RND transporter periplasmic adaptor subunit [Myxococcales bacterium]|nr:efflux RND transporter periplasmic adaptor subunit [Myxococcales bacterium]